MADRPARSDAGPAVAGLELTSGGVRATVGHREDGRLRLTGRGAAALPGGAVSGGLVVDRGAVAGAIGRAVALAERREHASRVIAAIDGDDVRTYHVSVRFERRALEDAIAEDELARAVHAARERAAHFAREAAGEDPALRGLATVQLRDDPAGFSLDGRSLRSVIGFHGRDLEIRTDVSLAPLLHAAAAAGAVQATRRPGGAVVGAYALGRLVAASGLADGAAVRLGSDVTSVAIVREGRVVATRAFGLGREALLSRTGDRQAHASIWSRCVAAPLPGFDGRPPGHWYLLGVPDELGALARALADTVAALREGPVDVRPLGPAMAGRVVSDVAMDAEDLVAAGAAFVAAEVA